MRVLIVKTTSMGDVVHAVPVVEDIKRFISDAEIDWLVEDSFADIPRHVAGVSEVIECSVRKWKKKVMWTRFAYRYPMRIAEIGLLQH